MFFLDITNNITHICEHEFKMLQNITYFLLHSFDLFLKIQSQITPSSSGPVTLDLKQFRFFIRVTVTENGTVQARSDNK